MGSYLGWQKRPELAQTRHAGGCNPAGAHAWIIKHPFPHLQSSLTSAPFAYACDVCLIVS